MTEKDLMLSGQLYTAEDPELMEGRRHCQQLIRLFNNTTEEQMEYRETLLRKLFKKVGKNVYIEPTLRCDYGKNISIGENFYASYDCIMLDVCDIKIGNDVFFGPRVGVYTSGHPVYAPVRDRRLEFGKEIRIGNSVWVGAGAIINPGVFIGNNVVIGSGAVVTHDIPDNVVAAGNPCKVIRQITDQDKEFWERKEAQYYINKSKR